MKFKYRKFISLLLCICMLFSMGSSVFAADTGKVDKSQYNFQTVQNDKTKTIVKAVYEGDEIYATLDKKTHEVTMQTIEYPKLMGLKIGDAKKTDYKVKIDEAFEGKLSATVTNLKNQKEYKFNREKVKAQFVIPLVVIIGEVLLDYLISISATIVISGIIYAIASEITDDIVWDDPDYYMAQVTGGEVYVGSAIDFSTAVSRATSRKDVFCKNNSKAKSLANAAGNWSVPIGPEVHGSWDPEYYWHYHPGNQLTQPRSHEFFFW